ncbi:3-(3-hydroxyphenyl)propionate hydroxylase [Spongiactinospora gelatinilytica]|uniref:3-(3-hydroxyphenyl)propionate hydroxylase n=1 Tax=Spongiactinospora gelatinilytica TaxID=2666298 RepID=A0A2W2I1E2_9ACTN|nr:bifunctional 3-(3-hydroxy-phenyl)propionate/3-hydroxycinnamic acid hydroxylase [Spongiactinospora gelatinilytica]PZG52017.1 3-(3-hydroxyphenyl)propionate hydroxylase [Spongiactinospora gelatinilytica]
MTSVIPVLVAGAGPTGVTAAALLAGYGVRSLVVDPHPDVYPLPRAVHLDDEVMRILQAVGVAEDFAAISHPSPGMRLLDGELRTIAEFRRDDGAGRSGWPQANMFDQPDLEALLRAGLARRPEAELRPGTEVVGIEQDGRGPVRVRLRDVASGRQEEVRAHALLGCDGANSRTRRHVGARMRDLGFAERWLVADVRCAKPLDVWDGVHQVCDPRRPATFMRIGPERYRWEVRAGQREAADRATLLRLISPWTRGVPEDELHVLRQAIYTFRAQVADRWRRGRVFLLGDAAHLTPPFIGQGLGAGLRDAANLAWKLALVLAEGAHERLLDTYRAERAPHVTHMIRTAVAVGRVMAGPARVARLLLSPAGRLPAATPGGSPRLRRGPLVRPRRPWGDLAGTLPPQPWVTVDGRHRRLDDVLGGSFAVLTLSPLDPLTAALARRLRARVFDLVATPIDDGTLARWLLGGRASAVLLRPDRVVLAAAPLATGTVPIGRDAAAWLPLLPPSPTTPITAERNVTA